MLTSEQLEQRRTRIGSSDIPAIAGLDEFRTPIAVWMHKRGLEDSATEQTEIGDMLEEPIAQMAAKRLRPDLIRPVGTVSGSPEQWMQATPDREMLWHLGAHFEGRILECKNVGGYMVSRWDGGIPAAVHAQLTWQLGVLGLERGHVAALLGGRTFELYDVIFDASYFADLMDIGRAFVKRYLEPGICPPVDGSDAAARYLAHRYHDAGTVLRATPEHEDLAAELRQIRGLRKAAQQREVLFEQRIKDAMGDHQVLELGNGERIRWSATKEHVVREHTVKAGRRFKVPASWGEA